MCTYITGIVNSVMSVNQCRIHLLKTAQVLLHAIVHPKVYVAMQITFSYSNIGRNIDLCNCKSTDAFRLINSLLTQANTLFAFIAVSEACWWNLNLYQIRCPSLYNYQLT